MSASGSRTLIALALQLTALGVLGSALLGASWLDARSKPRVLVLVDRSQSVPRAASDNAIAEVTRAAKAAGGGELHLLEFAGRPAAPSMQATDTAALLEPSATNIEAAMQAALAAHAQAAFASVVVISDGQENVGDAAGALHAARQAQLPVHWIAVGHPPPPTRIAEVLAPDRALLGQGIQVTVQLAGQLNRPLRVKAIARTAGGDTQAASSETTGEGRAKIVLEGNRSGAVLVDVSLEDPATGQTLDTWSDAAVIEVAPPAAMLYVQGSTGPLAQSLKRAGWTMNIIPAARLDAHADSLDGYQAVVLDDVAVSDAGPRFWRLLLDAVKSRGIGLMVLGGERSFARGGYRGSALESILPVLSEPAALDQPAAIVFAVDKSGSMGRGSGGVDRFQLAQRAVLETARGLTGRDSLGLVVFDVVPRVLIPLGPAPAGTLALERDWQARPNGGTRIAPALEAAISELERSGAARRILVIVTDGFIDGAPLAGLRARLDRSRVETIALAVGPDADVSALERIVGKDGGVVYRVDQAAELPLVMRTGLERRRARIERGAIAVEQRHALPFSPGTVKDWPDVAAYAVTRPRPEALVAAQSQHGEPLVAFQDFGRGRVVAVTCGLGPWTPQWWQWREWPGLAGGLANWISATTQGGAVALAVSDLPAGMQIEANLPAGITHTGPEDLSITVDTPTAPARVLSMDLVAPGRLRATLPDDGPGLYTFLVSSSHGTQRQLHLRRQRAENQSWGISPALDAWKSAELIGDWSPRFLAQAGDGQRERPAVDRSLIGLGLALVLAGILVERTKLKTAGIMQSLRRWRPRGTLSSV